MGCIQMPKVIKNLESKIINTALALMETHPYDTIDMRLIAKTCGIAVGTVYNYFPSKHALFSKVIILSWQETYGCLLAIANSDLDGKSKLLKYVTFYYSSMESRKGIGRKIFFNSDLTSNLNKHDIHTLIAEIDDDDPLLQLHNFKDSILNDLCKLLDGAMEISTQQIDKKKLAYTIFIAGSSLVLEFPNEIQGNTDFMLSLVESFISNN